VEKLWRTLPVSGWSSGKLQTVDITQETDHKRVMEEIEIYGLPAFRDNRLWCIRRGRSAVVIDPGDAAVVRRYLDANGLTLEALLLTHHHADHVGGVAELIECTPNLTVYGPAAESIAGVTRPLCGGETLQLLGATWSVLAAPGHTRGHLAYCLDESTGDRAVEQAGSAHSAKHRQPLRLFSGDVLFGLGCGRLFEGSPEDMAGSLAAIAALPDDTQVFCAHEYTLLNLPFAQTVMPDNPALRQRAGEIFRRTDSGEGTLPLCLGEEKATNPFLRCADPRVVASAVARANSRSAALSADDPVAVFACLREWRNQF